MVQVAETRRARKRAHRTEAIRRAALRIVAAEGLDALTMQRVAAEADCAVGSLYTYFPAKGALLAEVQRWAIERLERSFAAGRAALPTSTDPADPLVRLVAFAEFWVRAPAVYPDETRLLELYMSHAGTVMSDDDVAHVLPAAVALLGRVADDLAHAAERGVLTSAPPFERVVLWAGAMNGVGQAGRLERIDPQLFDGPRLVRAVTRDLLIGWGARAQAVARAFAAVAAIDLAPRIVEEEP